MTDDTPTTPVLSAEQIAADDAEVYLIAGKPSDGATIERDPATGLIATITEPTADTKGTDRG